MTNTEQILKEFNKRNAKFICDCGMENCPRVERINEEVAKLVSSQKQQILDAVEKEISVRNRFDGKYANHNEVAEIIKNEVLNIIKNL